MGDVGGDIPTKIKNLMRGPADPMLIVPCVVRGCIVSRRPGVNTNKNSKRGLFIFILFLFAAKKNRASPVIAFRFRYGLSSTFSTKAKAYYERCVLIFY